MKPDEPTQTRFVTNHDLDAVEKRLTKEIEKMNARGWNIATFTLVSLGIIASFFSGHISIN